MIEELPLLLAGPIVRRVEPNLVAVWVALKERRAVRLSVWAAPVDTGSGDTPFNDPSPLMQGHAETLRIGERFLHRRCRSELRQPAAAGTHLRLQHRVRSSCNTAILDATEDLLSLELLRDHLVPSPGFALPHLALGYERGLLPDLRPRRQRN